LKKIVNDQPHRQEIVASSLSEHLTAGDGVVRRCVYVDLIIISRISARVEAGT
jgi:hypothetical protein